MWISLAFVNSKIREVFFAIDLLIICVFLSERRYIIAVILKHVPAAFPFVR